jgi:hypothetical protein
MRPIMQKTLKVVQKNQPKSSTLISIPLGLGRNFQNNCIGAGKIKKPKKKTKLTSL